MFNPVFTDPDNSLLKDRLARIEEDLRALNLPTREEYQAEVFSRINRVLELGYSMTPLTPVGNAGPAVIGDIVNNTSNLNRDIEDISKEVLRVENIAATSFNLSATTQNSLRQQIREHVFGSNSRRYTEQFINADNISDKTATLDFGAGVATLPVVNELDLTNQVSITIGGNTIGSVITGVENLTDNRVETFLELDGTSLELVLSFNSPQIINRLILELDDYQGLEVSSLSTSPDGTLTEDILVDLGVDRILLNGKSGKFSGNVIIDFPPRHMSTMRLVIQDLVGEEKIAIRSLSIVQRQYDTSGNVKSSPINNVSGTVKFTADQIVIVPVTSVTHQISYNGTDFTVIQPNDTIALVSNPFWYRAVLNRDASKAIDSPVVNLDPNQNNDYQISSSVSTVLGSGILQRVITFNSVTGPIVFRELPLAGTFKVQDGATILDPSGYVFVDKTLSFDTSKTVITVSYQTTALGPAAIQDRQQYFSPLLYGITFERT